MLTASVEILNGVVNVLDFFCRENLAYFVAKIKANREDGEKKVMSKRRDTFV